MPDTLEMQEYLESYVPDLVGKFLAEKPIPNMEDTTFTVQVTVEGEKSLTFGITIKNAREISVHPGGLENPMLSVSLSEEIIARITREISHFTTRKQYDGVTNAKGTLTVEAAMPGDWVLPVTITFNGAAEPKATLRGPAEVMSKVMAGQISGPEAFMQGQIKFEGDMMFLMSLGSFL